MPQGLSRLVLGLLYLTLNENEIITLYSAKIPHKNKFNAKISAVNP
jgi:hypothetical protein